MDCLDEDTVLALIDGTLDTAARAAAESHLAICSSCSDLVAAAAGAEPTRLAQTDDGDDDRTEKSAGLARGASVGRYVILSLVGRGGMGEVYAAYDPQLDRRVALKLLHEVAPFGSSAKIARERLLREAKAIARLSHPNVVVVHDAGALDDAVRGERVFLAMEFIEGDTLATWLAAAPRSWRAIRDVFVSAGEGLAAAHDAGLVHRDFKPQNVMVSRDGGVRVMDFGLASDATSMGVAIDRPFDPVSLPAVPPSANIAALTRTGALLGTPLYMAPEQFASRGTDARTDQFSFCVALYEALYGERPFPADSFPVLAEAVLAGRVREPPQKARVPAFLRKLLLRALKANPAERWPSMRVLLDSLRRDPARRRRGLAMGAILAVVAVAAAVGSQRLATRGERLCRAASDKLVGVWEIADGGARRTAIHRAFLGTGRSFAEETWKRVSGLLDDYGRRWKSMYTDACEATHVRGDQSPEVLDLRMTCLEGQRGNLHALTDVLAGTDAKTLVEAVNAVQALPTIDRCADIATLRAAVPPPSDAKTRSRVTALRLELAQVKALSDTGQFPAGLRKAAPLAEAAKASGYGPVLAETLAARAWLESSSGELDTCVATYEEALWEALAGRRDDIALESVAQLVGIVGNYLGREQESERWSRLGEALLRRIGPGHERTAAWFYQDRGAARERHGDLRGALADLEQALSLKRKVLSSGHPDIGLTQLTIANVSSALGDYAGALAAANEAVDIYRDAYGPNSPLLGHPLGNRGEVFAVLGRYAEAERDLRDSVERWTTWVGPDHLFDAYPLTALGKTLLAEGRRGDAIPVLQRALRIRERSEPNPELVAETRFALARALWDVDQRGPDARRLAETAVDVFRKIPAQAKQAAEVDAWLADHAEARRKNSR